MSKCTHPGCNQTTLGDRVLCECHTALKGLQEAEALLLQATAALKVASRKQELEKIAAIPAGGYDR